MNLLPQYLNWLGSAEDVLVERDRDNSHADIEALLERILWHLTSSFFTGPFIKTEEPLRDPDSTIQYFCFPLFSHFKEISGIEPYWLNRYPIFFGRRSEVELSKVITQYAFLYRGLRKKESHFSLTSFAGNMKLGLSHPPRYMLFDLEENSAAPNATAEITANNQIFALIGHMPSAPNISTKLSSVQTEAIKNLITSYQAYPVIGGHFNANLAAAFWKSFDEIVDACSNLEEAIKDIERYADIIESSLQDKIEERLILRDGRKESKEATAKGLARFVAQNYVLGFRKIVYCPFRIAEQTDAGHSELVSWGGGILVLSDTVRLTTIQDYLTTYPEAAWQDSSDKKVFASLCDLIMAIRFFVDVATPKVIFGDWKYYRRVLEGNSISKIHAKGISQGIGHELRGINTFIATRIDEVKLKEIAPILDTSTEIAELVWEAYANPDQTLSLSDLKKKLRKSLKYTTLSIDWKGITPHNSQVRVPSPLHYVLAELCRNAFKSSIGDPVKTPRTVIIEFTIEQDELSEIRVLNQTERNHPPINCENRINKKITQTIGLNIVMEIVCDRLGGTFSFEIANGQAIASVKFAPPQRL